MLAKRLACVNVGQMSFNHGKVNGRDGITQRHAGMRQPPRINDNTGEAITTSGMNSVDQLSFMIGLKGIDGSGKLVRKQRQGLIDIGKRLPAINVGLSLAKQV
jgi:hypothetical protein